MLDRKRAMDKFIKLAGFNSESFHEADIAAYLANALIELGFLVSVDEAGKKLSNNTDSAGNIYGFLKGNTKGEPILLSAHMDTVAPGIGKKVVIHEDDRVTSDGKTVLGSDDITGIVTILEAISYIQRNNLPHPDIEVIFFVAEEPFCKGSSVFDFSIVKSKIAYVFDLSGSVGTISNEAPSIISFTTSIHGKAAHSGFEPEKGINAILIAANTISKLKLGRINSKTTVNIGIVSGGTGKNIVPALVSLEGEVRSLSSDEAIQYVIEIKETLEKEAEKLGGTIDFSWNEDIKAYRIEEDSYVIKRYQKALDSLSYGKANIITTFGGSDNNNFNKYGITGLVVSNAMNQVHTVNEYFYIDELIKSIQIAIELIKE